MGKEKIKRRKIWNNKRFWVSLLIFAALVLAHFKILELPDGGSVTYCGMLALYLVAYFYGPLYGMGAGFLYGAIRILLLIVFDDVAGIPAADLFLEYCIAYASLGFGGLLHEKKHGLQFGYCLSVIARFLVHLAAGVIFYASPDKTFTQNLIYSAQYNGGYLVAEGITSLAILCIPPAVQAIDYIKFVATTDEEAEDLDEF